MAVFTLSSPIGAPADEVFDWHARPGALERLIPPWQHVEVMSRSGGIEDGARVELRLGRRPLALRWVAGHRDFDPPFRFRDVQEQGPFARWDHTHSIVPEGDDRSRLEDRIDYELPLSPLSTPARALVERQLERAFRYRHRTTAADLEQRHRERLAPMRVLVSGASGLIGSALVPFLTAGGDSVARLVRRAPAPGEQAFRWDPRESLIDAGALAGIDAVVHLAGETVAGRWTAAKRERILASRRQGTRLIAEAVARADPQPTLVCVSAVGWYGDRAGEHLDERSAAGDGFLADVVREWEAACAPARAAGARVVNLRFGIVLSPRGGALGQMLPPFRLGAGAALGNGRQWTSWVGVDDVLGAILHVLARKELEGAVNVTAPQPVTNRELTKSLARVLHRPALARIPAPALVAALGDFARESLLASQRVAPTRLIESGYRFRQPELGPALAHLLGR